MAKRSVQLVVSVFTNATGIQNNNISLIVCFNALHAVGFKKTRNALRVVRVHLAPKGVHYI
jgi:hypothetical protein